MAVAQDITDKKKLAEKLREKKIRFRILFESASDGIFLLDRDGSFIEANTKTADLYGCTKEYLIGKAPYDFSPKLQPDGKPSKEKALEKIRSAFSKTPQFFEWLHLKSDGTPIYTEVSLTYVDIPQKPVILAIVRDIIARKKLEQLKNKQEKRLKMMLEGIPHPAWLITTDRKIIAQNKAAETMGSKIGNYCWEVLSEDFGEIIKTSKVIEKIKCDFCPANTALKKDTPINW